MPDDASEPVGILRVEEQRWASAGCEARAGVPVGAGKLLLSSPAVWDAEAVAGVEVEGCGGGPMQGQAADARAGLKGDLSKAVRAANN